MNRCCALTVMSLCCFAGEATAQNDDWREALDFDEEVLAPRTRTWTSTIVPPRTDIGLALGSRELGVSAIDDRLGVGGRLGPRVIHSQIYFAVTPTVWAKLDRWRLALQLPLNLLLLQPGTNTFGRLAIRARDWDEPADYTRILRSIDYKDASTKIAIDAFTPRTILHGQVVWAYQPSIDLDRPSTGALLEYDTRSTRAELVVADVAFRRAIVAGSATVRPFELADTGSSFVRSLSVGAELAVDFSAPGCLRPSPEENRCIRAVGNRPGVDVQTSLPLDDTFVATSRDDGLPPYAAKSVVALGTVLSAELHRSDKLLVDSYASWHTLIGGGHGLALGLSIAGTRHRGFRVEARVLTDRFVYGYFDTLYEVEKFESFARAPETEIAPTRYQAVFGDDDAGVEPVAAGPAFGYRVTGAWQFFPETPLTVTLGLENTSRRGDTKIFAHGDLRVHERLHMFGTLLRIGADGRAIRGADQGGVVVLGGARLTLFDTIAVRARYAYLQSLGHAPGAELHLGDDRVVGDLDFRRDRLFVPVHIVGVEIELGWHVL